MIVAGATNVPDSQDRLRDGPNRDVDQHHAGQAHCDALRQRLFGDEEGCKRVEKSQRPAQDHLEGYPRGPKRCPSPEGSDCRSPQLRQVFSRQPDLNTAQQAQAMTSARSPLMTAPISRFPSAFSVPMKPARKPSIR